MKSYPVTRGSLSYEHGEVMPFGTSEADHSLENERREVPSLSSSHSKNSLIIQVRDKLFVLV